MAARRMTGRYQRTVYVDEVVDAFIPYALPPAQPPLQLTPALLERLRVAEQALVHLDLAGEMVPSLDWFVYAFVRKEAVLSSQIEGTQATLVDLLSFEVREELTLPEEFAVSPSEDIEEICNYLAALKYSRAELADPHGLPLSMRLLDQTHARLLQGVRGADKRPGERRTSQNWIGGSRPGNAMYVPPPPEALADTLSAFEKYIHSDDGLPKLVRAGLLHVQFESIHPYLDGNGRMGRLLVTLLLEHWQLLSQPLLYLSLFFKRHREEYYRRLSAVRTEGDWEGWLDFFLDGVATIANEAVDSVRELFALYRRDHDRLLAMDNVSIGALRLFQQLPHQPIVNVALVVKRLSSSKPTAQRAIEQLCLAGILREQTGKKRDRSYLYASYLDRLKVDTEL